MVRAVIRIMEFWLSHGVDGFRLDAIPYLCEREGTNNENLRETHDIIKRIRQVISAKHPDRMLLAEANQWPEDVRDYFGDGDECHMAYHFPLMPRMYMAIAQEDRHPIVEIMDQTPDIPDTCQWAVFLRNHDELTLEMVTSRERDYMYQAYAADTRARLNLGIRRRLAPLMENDPERIKLMNSLLLSMPGSPIIYYGDEIGMGDNFYLGDRNGVRTPMQWSPDRNAGFSRADPQQLYLPPIMDPIYGYEAVNVEAQTRDRSSLLNWMRRMLAVRKTSQAFGRGTLRFIRPGNRKVLVYLRQYGEDTILCVANLSRTAQPVEIELAEHKGSIPIELLGRTPFPPVGELPYLLTLPAYGFYWFRLSREAAAPSWHDERLPREDLPVLVLVEGWNSFFPDKVAAWRAELAKRLRAQLEERIVPQYLASAALVRGQGSRDQQRPAAGSCRAPGSAAPLVRGNLLCREPGGERALFRAARDSVRGCGGGPLAQAADGRARPRSPTGDRRSARGCLRRRWVRSRDHRCDRELGGAAHPGGPRAIHAHRALRGAARRPGRGAAGEPHGRPDQQHHPAGRRWALPQGLPQAAARLEPRARDRPLSHRGRPLPQHRAGRRRRWSTPTASPASYTMALLQAFVTNQGDGWTYTVDYLARFLEDRRSGVPMLDDAHGLYLSLVRTLAIRTAELHRALARADGRSGFRARADCCRGRGRMGRGRRARRRKLP